MVVPAACMQIYVWFRLPRPRNARTDLPKPWIGISSELDTHTYLHLLCRCMHVYALHSSPSSNGIWLHSRGSLSFVLDTTLAGRCELVTWRNLSSRFVSHTMRRHRRADNQLQKSSLSDCQIFVWIETDVFITPSNMRLCPACLKWRPICQRLPAD